MLANHRIEMLSWQLNYVEVIISFWLNCYTISVVTESRYLPDPPEGELVPLETRAGSKKTQFVEMLSVDWWHLSRCLQINPRAIWCPWKLRKDQIYSNCWNVAIWLMSFTNWVVSRWLQIHPRTISCPRYPIYPNCWNSSGWLMSFMKMSSDPADGDLMPLGTREGSNLSKLLKCYRFTYVILSRCLQIHPIHLRSRCL